MSGKVFSGNGILLTGQTADPSSLTDGQLWYRTDTDFYRTRANGTTVSVPQVFVDGHTTTSIGTTKTVICTITLPAGVFAFQAGGTIINTAANSASTQFDFSGTATVGYNGFILASSGGLIEAFNNTTFGVTMSGSSLTNYRHTWDGVISVTVGGALDFAGTCASSAKSIIGNYLNCVRIS